MEDEKYYLPKLEGLQDLRVFFEVDFIILCLNSFHESGTTLRTCPF